MIRSILALDLATRTGFAHWKEGMDAPIYGVLELPKAAEIGRFIIALRRWMIPFCQLEAVTDVVYEAAMVRPGRDDENIIMRLFGLASEAAANAYDLGARPEPVKHGKMAVYWYGAEKFIEKNGISGRDQGKAYSKLAAKLKGWDCDYDDEADALGLLCFYLNKWAIKAPFDLRPCPAPAFLDLAAKGKIRA